jgi:glutamate synthase domain-containing protein 1
VRHHPTTFPSEKNFATNAMLVTARTKLQRMAKPIVIASACRGVAISSLWEDRFVAPNAPRNDTKISKFGGTPTMCGIVGYIGARDATPIIFNGLKRLEYRGYDSAGVAVINGNQIEVRRDAGKLSQLIDLVSKDPVKGAPGIGHTRWATHGAPSARNAHPHVGNSGKVVIVHNGIVENFLELKDELTSEGVTFNSETDTETIVHLAEHLKATGIHWKRPPAKPSTRSRVRTSSC